ncbi:PP2C family protein-serine/threonine phosphatase [Fodinicola acaciae]|uniref:PP2C family protein-serine/threonine phosphatase n=1 Tax=Fodinicola acaciae TaxID=2681555 RepID=UPI0013D52C5A|nr:protein phosphatase 2C domain-containing protein [Fodinicola acaciae]
MITTAHRLRTGASSHPGRVRENNQDSYFAGERLIVVADGVGGAAGGEVASAAAITAISVMDGEIDGDPVAAFAAAADDAAARIRSATEAEPDLAGMGTTLSAFLLHGDQIVMAHAGDSRAYRLRGAGLEQLSRDDSYVQLLIERGSLRPEDAETHPQRNLVTKVLQTDPVELSIRIEPVEVGDRYLVCSDGLSGVVNKDLITSTMLQIGDPEACTAQLIELALERGAPDNVTAVIGDVLADEEPPAAPPAPAAEVVDESDMPETVKLPQVEAEVAATGTVVTAQPPEPKRGLFSRIFRRGRRRQG